MGVLLQTKGTDVSRKYMYFLSVSGRPTDTRRDLVTLILNVRKAVLAVVFLQRL
jgi:hypothetical protein